MVDYLWKKYPNGLVANVSKGSVPERARGMARYLAKYVACPPIAVRRIINYNGRAVTYWYKDHHFETEKVVGVDVDFFVFRIVDLLRIIIDGVVVGMKARGEKERRHGQRPSDRRYQPAANDDWAGQAEQQGD
mgnify:CR=1 FL=1